MKISRKRVLAAGAAAGTFASIGFLRYPGDAAQFSFKLGIDQPVTFPPTQHAIDAAAKVQQDSDGQLEIKVFPSSALGSDTDMISQARSGALEMLIIGNNILANVVPAAALEGLPFAYTSTQQLLSTANGELGAYIGAQALKTNLRMVPGSWYGGTFEMENTIRPINTPDDLKGMKLRVPPGPLDVSVMKAFGASPTVIPIADVYVSLQTHLVDGMAIPLLTVDNFKFYELIKYVSMTDHNHINYMLFVNKDVFDRLPKNLQQLVDKTFGAAAAAATSEFIAREGTVASTLKGHGLTFNQPPIEPFRQVIRNSGLYAQWRDQFDPTGWKIMEKTTGKLA